MYGSDFSHLTIAKQNVHVLKTSLEEELKNVGGGTSNSELVLWNMQELFPTRSCDENRSLCAT